MILPYIKKSIGLLITLALLIPPIASLAPVAQAGAVMRGRAVTETAADPYWRNVKLLAVNESAADAATSFTDLSNSKHTLTANGNAQWDTAQAPTGLGSSALFDGTGDRLTIADNADLELGTSDFTWEAYVRLSTTAGTREVFGKRNGGVAEGLIFGYLSSGSLFVYISSNGASWDIASAQSLGVPTVDTWHHLAVTRQGSTFRAFKDGSQTSTWSSSAAINDNTKDWRIGGGGDGDISGWIAGVRITKGVARYTSNFTAPTLPLPVGEGDESFLATGGTVTTVGNYRVHTFTSSGTFRVLRGKTNLWYLVVAGGGGGGRGQGGGGGAGGYRTNGAYSYPVSTGSYSVTVGAGGAGSATVAKGSSGEDTTFATITSVGGGGGGSQNYPTASTGVNGGSGGGGSAGNTSGAGGTGTAGQGSAGGTGNVYSTLYAGGGGGGGASGIGSDGVANATTVNGGAGGPGTSSSITGSAVTRAGGGGGGGDNRQTPGTGGAGGSGGGGAGGGPTGVGATGTANTGSGGGGGAYDGTAQAGGNGGSGVVIIRYPAGTTKTNVSASPSSLTNSLVGWWTFDGPDVSDKVYDRSGQGNHGYFVGGATTSAKTIGKLGQGLGFNGISSHVSVPSTTSIKPSQITLCAWVKSNVYATLTIPIAKKRSSGGHGSYGLVFRTGPNRFTFTISDATPTEYHTTSTNMATGVWQHWCGTYDGSVQKLYLNGGIEDTQTPSIAISHTDTYPLTIGSYDPSQGLYLDGLMDDVRIYNRALTAAEVKLLYNQGAATKSKNPPINGLVGYWSFDQGFVTSATSSDRSGRGDHGTLVNGPTQVVGKIGSAMSFNGSSQRITATGNSSYSALTTAFWVKFNSLANSYNGTIGQQTSGSPNVGGYTWFYNSGVFKLFARSNSVNFVSEESTGLVPTLGRWYHMAMTWDSAGDGKVRFYLDGALSYTSTGSSNSAMTGVPTLMIGALQNPFASSQALNGSLDDVRIYNRALTYAEVQQLYQSR